MTDYETKFATIKNCFRYIDQHLQEPLYLPLLARQCRCSYNTFRQDFEMFSGYTPHRYIRLRRVQLAAQMLREGNSIIDAASAAGFETPAGFYKAFRSVYGMSPQRFHLSRGIALMPPPVLQQFEDLTVAGYVLKPDSDFMPRSKEAYWMMQSFPTPDEAEWVRIGCDTGEAGLWVREGRSEFYLFGPCGTEIRYIPKNMKKHRIPGGTFLKFPVPRGETTLILYENILATWYYAREQYLPGSGYEADPSRVAFELYCSENSSVCIPVRKKKAV